MVPYQLINVTVELRNLCHDSDNGDSLDASSAEPTRMESARDPTSVPIAPGLGRPCPSLCRGS